MPTTIEITIRATMPPPNDAAPVSAIGYRLSAMYTAELRAELPHSRADLGGAPVQISAEALRGLELLPDAYGAALTAMALPPALHPAWAKARGYAAGAGHGLHVRVAIDDPSGALHALRWELLRDPLTNAPLATQEGGSLARLVVIADLHDAAPPPRPALHALVAVAGPSDADRWGLAPVDVAAEAARALDALGAIPAELLAHGHASSSGRATLASLRHGLRKPAHLLYLIAHGRATDAGTALYLEGDDGSAAPITGADLAEAIGALAPDSRPLLAVLVTCEGADQAAAPLASVGPLLARAGVPAVIAMQTQVSMASAARFTARLLRELERDGRIDRALAAARAEMGDEWWAPVLWLRSRGGRLWAGDDERAIARRQRLVLARSRHSQERFAELRQGFVGRQAELATIHAEVDALRAAGGYLLVTGVAGQGKSSVLAAFIAERGPETTPAYFIRFSPGADEQVALLRHLVAELLVQHGMEELTEGYLPEAAGTITLANSLAMVLDRISAAGQPATLVIDGLDQIRPDRQMGERDLSFLPEKLPAGVVIIIGTRPDDTLKPLKVLASQREYKLPPLSLDDFAALLDQRGAALATHERQALYDALHGNAFDLAFVVREIAATAATEVPTLLERVRQNPQDIFTPALDRLRNEPLWRRAIRPILGCLLVATDSEPLSEEALGAILGLDTDEVSEAILRLRGFLGETDRSGRAYFYLYHLKLIDYLKGAQGSAGTRIFSVRDVEQYHGRIIAWCEIGGLEIIWQDAPGNALDQERREYARQHYIAHLAAARSYEQLWSVIDDGEYGAAKRRHDPSTRSYALDLDIARQAVVDAAAGNITVQARGLPRLWKYSLLRCSLTSQVDNYPEELFLALVALGRGDEALSLVELLSDSSKQAKVLQAIDNSLQKRASDNDFGVLKRTRSAIEAMQAREPRKAKNPFDVGKNQVRLRPNDPEAVRIADEMVRAADLRDVAISQAEAGQFVQAYTTANGITREDARTEALIALAAALSRANQADEADLVFNEAALTAVTIRERIFQSQARQKLAFALMETRHYERAREVADTIKHSEIQATTLKSLAITLVKAQHYERAREVTDTIKHSEIQAITLTNLAIALNEAGQIDQAESCFVAAQQAINEFSTMTAVKAKLLGALAYAFFKGGRVSDAVRVANDARSTALVLTDQQQRNLALHALIDTFIRIKSPEEALSIADMLPEAHERTSIRYRVIVNLLSAGEIGRARVLIGELDDSVMHISALAQIALALACVGCIEEANLSVVEARRFADAKHANGVLANALCRLGYALIQAGQSTIADTCLDVAYTTAKAIADFEDHCDTFASLAETYVYAGQLDKAHQVINTIPDQRKRADALYAISAILVQMHRGAASAAFFSAAYAQAVALHREEIEQSPSLWQGIGMAYAYDGQAEAIADIIKPAIETLLAQALIAELKAQDTTLTSIAKAIGKSDAQIQQLWWKINIDPLHVKAFLNLASETPEDGKIRVASEHHDRPILSGDAVNTIISSQIVSTIERWSHIAQTRDELLRLFAVDAELFRAYPELGKEFLDSFAWVDAQLTAG